MNCVESMGAISALWLGLVIVAALSTFAIGGPPLLATGLSAAYAVMVAAGIVWQALRLLRRSGE